MQGQANHFSQYAPERIPYVRLSLAFFVLLLSGADLQKAYCPLLHVPCSFTGYQAIPGRDSTTLRRPRDQAQGTRLARRTGQGNVLDRRHERLPLVRLVIFACPRSYATSFISNQNANDSPLLVHRVLCSPYAGIPRSELPPSVKAWVERNLGREAVKKGLMDQSMNEDMVKKIIETGEAPSEPKHKA
jgi:hypothetical protein